MSYPYYDATQYSAANASGSQASRTGDAYNDLTSNDFLKMMVAELQNQDPLNPADNSDLINQISQIRAISANDKLATTLESVAMGQSFATASSLIGKTVSGLSDAGEKISGKVDRVTIENGEPKIYVGTSIVQWKNITGIS